MDEKSNDNNNKIDSKKHAHILQMLRLHERHHNNANDNSNFCKSSNLQGSGHNHKFFTYIFISGYIKKFLCEIQCCHIQFLFSNLFRTVFFRYVKKEFDIVFIMDSEDRCINAHVYAYLLFVDAHFIKIYNKIKHFQTWKITRT